MSKLLVGKGEAEHREKLLQEEVARLSSDKRALQQELAEAETAAEAQKEVAVERAKRRARIEES